MGPALAALTPLGMGDPQAAPAEVVTYFMGGLLTLTQRVLQARTPLSPPSPPSAPHHPMPAPGPGHGCPTHQYATTQVSDY